MPQGYSLNDTQNFVTAVSATYAHPNKVKDFAMLHFSEATAVQTLMSTRTVATNLSVDYILEQFFLGIQAVQNESSFEAQRSSLWSYLGYVPPSPPPPPPQPPPPPPPAAGSGGVSGAVLGPAVGVPVASLVVGGALLGLLLLKGRRQSEHKTLLGKIKAPGVGPESTILITGRPTERLSGASA
jgi:hypothetical protein